MNIKIKEVTNESPFCPHCEKEIKQVLMKRIQPGVRYVYFCDNCKKVLSISHRKTNWMT